MSNYQTIYDDELETFRNVCTDEGYEPDEFIFYEHSIVRPDTLGSIYGKVTIYRNGKIKTYKTGDDSSWHADFANDLKNNFFFV